jgi:15-cis-phytoene synthase
MTAREPEVRRAYEVCARITRQEAANFYYGIRLLPRPRREAMSAVYAFARRVDDIGDGDLSPTAKLASLEEQRATVRALDEGTDSGDPVAFALAQTRRDYDLPLDALELLIEGVELDVHGVPHETFDELLLYCRKVAGSIGRLCLTVFTDGRADASSAGLADDLGVAMQLTNIIRDVREDEAQGRIYLPTEDLRRFGFERLPDAPSDPAAELIRLQTGRARLWFERGMPLVERLDSRSAACLLTMTGVYRSILERIERDPCVVLRRRVSLPPWQKAWIAARSLAGRAGVKG